MHYAILELATGLMFTNVGSSTLCNFYLPRNTGRGAPDTALRPGRGLARHSEAKPSCCSPFPPILLIAEALLPYFTVEEHRRILGYLAEHFAGKEMLFKTMAPSLIQGLVQYSCLSKMSTNIEVRWGLDKST